MFGIHVLRKYLYSVLLVFALTSWAIFASFMALRKSDKLLLIGIDQNGTRIITGQDDPLFKTEVVNFIRRFFVLLYNFDSGSFKTNIGSASDLMALPLWKLQEPKILKLSDKLKTESINHSGVVKSISKEANGEYQVVLKTNELYRMKNTTREILVKLFIQPVKRSDQNPWGMEVTSLEESKL